MYLRDDKSSDELLLQNVAKHSKPTKENRLFKKWMRTTQQSGSLQAK